MVSVVPVTIKCLQIQLKGEGNGVIGVLIRQLPFHYHKLFVLSMGTLFVSRLSRL